MNDNLLVKNPTVGYEAHEGFPRPATQRKTEIIWFAPPKDASPPQGPHSRIQNVHWMTEL